MSFYVAEAKRPRLDDEEEDMDAEGSAPGEQRGRHSSIAICLGTRIYPCWTFSLEVLSCSLSMSIEVPPLCDHVAGTLGHSTGAPAHRPKKSVQDLMRPYYGAPMWLAM